MSYHIARLNRWCSVSQRCLCPQFFTLLKMVVPLGYARLYAYGQRLPFLFAGELIVLSQALLLTIKGAGSPIDDA